MNRALLLTLAAFLSGCHRYADFRLPPPQGELREVALRWDVKPDPVMSPLTPWEQADVLNPSVIAHQGKLWNLYSAFDGKAWHTAVATSSDGLEWTNRNKILSPAASTWEGKYIAANGSALVRNNEILYWYQAGDPPRIALLRSTDGFNWARTTEPVLETGPRGSWDERGVADPYVIEASGKLYLFYLGQDRAMRQRLGIAVSEDGVTFTKLRTNPILELGAPGAFDEVGLGEPAIWTAHGRWWMLYTGRDRAEYRRLGLASSRDGLTWQRYSESAVLSGAQPWNSKVVCDPTLLPTANGKLRVWFGGGDVAHPAENIHGKIGYAELTLEPR